MKLAGALFALLVAAAEAETTKVVCGPQTEVCTSSTTTAASDPIWECKPASHGAKVEITPQESETMSAKVCGPGKFHFSPMQCAGDKFEYKKSTTEVDTSSTTTGCQIVTFPYGMACYIVEC